MGFVHFLTHTQHIRSFIGVGGVSNNESALARTTCAWFRRMLIPIAIVLLYQHFRLLHGTISMDVIFRNDWILWGFFVLEEITLLFMVQHKKYFIMHNWLNLLIILVLFPPVLELDTIVTLPQIRFLLFLRLLPPLLDSIINILFRNNISSTLMVTGIVTLLWGLLLPLFDTTVATPWDGIWLAWETVTTVGYGDIVPHTVAGRILAILLMIAGVALTSLLTANFASFILNRSEQHKQSTHLIHDKLKAIEEKIDNINNKINKLSP